jgi:hypothetical protein
VYPQKITDILTPVLQQHPAYQLQPVTYRFGNSRVEITGPADTAVDLDAQVQHALRQNGFDSYPLENSSAPIALTVRAREL